MADGGGGCNQQQRPAEHQFFIFKCFPICIMETASGHSQLTHSNRHFHQKNLKKMWILMCACSKLKLIWQGFVAQQTSQNTCKYTKYLFIFRNFMFCFLAEIFAIIFTNFWRICILNTAYWKLWLKSELSWYYFLYTPLHVQRDAVYDKHMLS